MSRKILLVVISVMLIFTSLTPVSAENSEPQISEPYKVFYVSPDGSDTNAGTLEAPFKTIPRARDEARKYTENMSGDIYVYLRGGNYYINETIKFGDQDSGTNGYSVYYKNYPGEEPIIYGGERITGWEQYMGDVYRTKLDIDADFYNLTENLERSIEACTPNESNDTLESYFTVAKVGTTSGMYTRLFYKPEDISEDLDYAGVRVKYYPEYKYGSVTLPIDSIDKKEDYFWIDSTGKDNFGDSYSKWIKAFDDAQYRLIGALEFLDTPGEFYVDRKGGWLYYWPKNLPINEQEIVAPTLNRIFHIHGADTDHIARNIHFEGLTVSTTDSAEIIMRGTYCDQGPNKDSMFTLENAQNIHITDCRIMNAGMTAVWLKGWAQENVIEGNYIKYTGETAIVLDGYHPTLEALGIFDSIEEAYCNKKNIIHNNFIREVGYNVGSGYAVCIYESGENQITNNELSKGPRFATAMLTLVPERGGHTYWGIETTETGMFNDGISQDFRFSQHNYIAFNDVYDFERETQDGGVLYGNGTGRGNRFFSNMVHDNWAAWDTASRFYPIYMDGSAMDWRSNNNITYNNACSGGGGISMLLNSAQQNEAQNNVYDVTGGTVAGVGVNSANPVVNRNIVYAGDKRNISIGGDDIETAWSMDANMYYAVDGEIEYNDIIGPDTFENRVAGGLYEQESLEGVDPMFVDPENHDYRLREDSPAFALGIQSIDQAAIGVTSDFKWRTDQPIQGKNFSNSDGIDRQLRISNTKDGGWAEFADVNFNHLKENKAWFTFRPQNGGTIELRLDAPDGELLCTVETGEKTDNSYKSVSADIPQISGIHNVYVVFKGNINVCDFDRMRFGSDYDPLPDVRGKTEEIRQAGKLSGAMVMTNAGETERVDTTVDPPGSLRLEFEDAELATKGVTSGDNGNSIGTFNEGTHLGFTQVEMDGVVSATINHGVPTAYAGATLELRLDAPDGPIIGTVKTVATHATAWNNYQPLTMKISPTTGIHDIYVTSEGRGDGIGNFDWLRLETGTDKVPVKHNEVIKAEGVTPIGVRTLGDLRVVSNGSLLKPAEPIYKKDGTVMTPLTDTLSKLGYSWNEETLTITDKEGKNLTFEEGNDIAYVNGVAGKLSTSPEKHENGSWWIPIDTFKLLGDYVDYVESSGYVRIMDVNEALRLQHLEKVHGEDRNLAYRKYAVANIGISDEATMMYPSNAVDGNPSTYWQEGNGDKEGWIWVDLGNAYSINRAVVSFGSYAPESFNVYVSNDIDNPQNWIRVANVSEVVGKTVEIKLPTAYARYVKIGDMKTSNNYGVHINEIEVYK